MELHDIIIKPYHTEKTYGLRKLQDPSCIAFLVNKKANKYEIKAAFKSIYNVEPTKINVNNHKAQHTKTGTKNPGFTKHFKVAYIILPPGIQLAILKDEVEEAAKLKNESIDEVKNLKEKSIKDNSKENVE